MKTIEDLKDEFEALIGKRVRLTLHSLPKCSYEGVLRRSQKAGSPYMLELCGGGRFIPHGKLYVCDLTEVA